MPRNSRRSSVDDAERPGDADARVRPAPRASGVSTSPSGSIEPSTATTTGALVAAARAGGAGGAPAGAAARPRRRAPSAATADRPPRPRRHHVLDREAGVVAVERRDPPGDVLRPPLDHPLHGDRGGGLDRAQLEPAGDVGHLEPQLVDAVAQVVGRGEVPRGAALRAFRSEPPGLGLAAGAQPPACRRTKSSTTASASSARSEWYRCPAPSSSTSSAPGMRSARTRAFSGLHQPVLGPVQHQHRHGRATAAGRTRRTPAWPPTAAGRRAAPGAAASRREVLGDVLGVRLREPRRVQRHPRPVLRHLRPDRDPCDPPGCVAASTSDRTRSGWVRASSMRSCRRTTARRRAPTRRRRSAARRQRPRRTSPSSPPRRGRPSGRSPGGRTPPRTAPARASGCSGASRGCRRPGPRAAGAARRRGAPCVS